MDGPCDSCLKTYPAWFTDNTLWNQVMGGRACIDDPGGLLCPRCFMLRAERTFSKIVWRVIPTWKEVER